MKFAPLILSLVSATTLAADTTSRRLESCLGEFSTQYQGDCNRESAQAAIQGLIDSGVGTNCLDAATELDILLGDLTIETVCATVYAEQAGNFTKFEDVSRLGDAHDREFFNGGTFWNEEIQVGTERNLAIDAFGVVLAYDSSYSTGISWPASPAISSVHECTAGAAMCCYVADRFKGTCGGGKCVFGEPEDNSDVCYVDMANAPYSARVASGIAVYDKVDSSEGSDSEGNVYCHGFAWDAADDTAASSRYKGNLLLKVGMKDHLYDKGYVQNVPGAPMCGCIEQMPVVSKAACTDLVAEETWQIEKDANGVFLVSSVGVDIAYGDCTDLATKAKELNPDIAYENYLIGDGQCHSAVDSFLAGEGIVRSHLEIVLVEGHPTKEQITVTFNHEVEDGAVGAFTIEGLTINSAALHPDNKAVLILQTSLQTYGTEYTLVTKNAISKRSANMVVLPVGTTAPFYAIEYGLSNAKGAENYNLALELDIPTSPTWGNTGVPAYTYGTEPISYFSRVAYFLELESEQYGWQWVWVSMDAFTQNVMNLGFPTRGAGSVVYDQYVDNVNILSNQPQITPCDDSELSGQKARLEFWPYSYGTSNSESVPFASNSLYDWGDDMNTGTYGSMQIHVPSYGEVLFGVNRWARNDPKIDIGIGNQPTGHPDWTFAENSDIYTLKKLSVLVSKEDNIDPAVFAPNNEAVGTADTEGYKLVYDLPVATQAAYGTSLVPYHVDYHKSVGTFERIAYYIELDDNWLWVSMNAFTDDASKIGVPTFASGAIFQQAVEDVNVFSSLAGMEASGITGNIEFWPNDYSTQNIKGIPNASDTAYDFGDIMRTTGDHGSMQIHNTAKRMTIFAYNNWNSNRVGAIGIGPNVVGEPDWTFADNAGKYTTKRIQVFVK
uniref:Uncharacterized protein n=2 Tax=Ditylum brightwellii TaxID=49249 RepID=A0A7S4RFU7_9STRA